MKQCPKCHATNIDSAAFCASCGTKLPEAPDNDTLKKAAAGGMLIGKKAREARKTEQIDPSQLISLKAYNGVIGAVLLWGLLINYILCSKVGVYTNLFPNMSPIGFLVGYIVLVIVGVILTNKSKSPAVSFIGFNLVVVPFGIVISTLVESYGGINSAIVTLAFLYTLLTCAVVLLALLLFPQAFAKLGRALGIVLIGLIVCEILLLIFHVRQQVTSWIAAALFSLYLGYDVYRSQQFPRTVKNAIASAMDIYMDLANLFIRILEILGDSRDRK